MSTDTDANLEVTEVVVTSKLREGDLVLNYGMRIRLGERKVTHDNPAPAEHGPVYWGLGTVENEADVVAEGLVPWSWMHRDAFVNGQWVSDPVPTWNVQGNDLAAWTRVVER